ncbi:hypothetical protein A1Q1_01524 [Trichosporon asahii var. asahii CBS 2479]|uniref:Uncharacterized protein n=1 Tax=Trichosporon asahii var. asahii (strain ATCC 90039 / CBS 2479 / JCM 2466 / KCTC 7840 / NBRC 103889/ NCYC 2677 / UAMH 7654) TaxID=1186058 RepID=J6F298_TRIAS|nr:hypothetical protein A1Q1_01524 [Trichosporon asahii var. asahii CBS 2479]EJT49322.1 hypothetical protein A1Q1_01524 [Trichosporon asahii var. asahii CBS 2479]
MVESPGVVAAGALWQTSAPSYSRLLRRFHVKRSYYHSHRPTTTAASQHVSRLLILPTHLERHSRGPRLQAQAQASVGLPAPQESRRREPVRQMAVAPQRMEVLQCPLPPRWDLCSAAVGLQQAAVLLPAVDGGKRDAVRRAESIWLSVPNAARIVPLLQAEICPETDIEVFHGNFKDGPDKTQANNGAVFNTALAVPPCRNLTVHVRIPCGCASGSLTGVWSHSARVIDIAFKVGCPYDSPHVVCSEFHTDCRLTICPFARHILTPTVEDVLISFYGYEDGIKAAVTRWLEILDSGALVLGRVETTANVHLFEKSE